MGQVDIKFETECEDLEWIRNPEDNSESVRLALVARDLSSSGHTKDTENIRSIVKDYDLLVGADGANAVVRYFVTVFVISDSTALDPTSIEFPSEQVINDEGRRKSSA